MAVGQRIRELRMQRQWSQVELGVKCNVHQKQISMYERGINAPSTELLIKMADVFDVTLNYLVYDDHGKDVPSKNKIHDRELLRRFEVVDDLPDPYRALAKEILDLLILKAQFQQLATNGAVRLTELRPTG